MANWTRLRRQSHAPRELDGTETIYAAADGTLKHMDPEGNLANLAGEGSLPSPTSEGDVLTVVEGEWAGEAPSGGSGSLTRAYLRLTPSDIGQAAFTPFEIVAGTADTLLTPVSGMFNYVGGTVGYDGGSEDDTDVQVYYDDPVTTQAVLLSSGPQAFWAGATAYAGPFVIGTTASPPATPVVDSNGLGLSIALNLSGSPLATGDSPLDVWVWYIAHDLSDLT